MLLYKSDRLLIKNTVNCYHLSLNVAYSRNITVTKRGGGPGFFKTEFKKQCKKKSSVNF